jgi:translation initiation factor IF-1
MASNEERETGLISESLPNGRFKVKINGKEYICYLAGKMVMNQIRCLVGEYVQVVLPRGSQIGRIVYRGK